MLGVKTQEGVVPAKPKGEWLMVQWPRLGVKGAQTNE